MFNPGDELQTLYLVGATPYMVKAYLQNNDYAVEKLPLDKFVRQAKNPPADLAREGAVILVRVDLWEGELIQQSIERAVEAAVANRLRVGVCFWGLNSEAADLGRRYMKLGASFWLNTPPGSDIQKGSAFACKYNLSPRQAQILQLLVLDGLSNKRIGQLLSMSEDTVKGQIKKMAKKLGVRRREAMISMAFREGLVE